jgi:hypothetical protein
MQKPSPAKQKPQTTPATKPLPQTAPPPIENVMLYEDELETAIAEVQNPPTKSPTVIPEALNAPPSCDDAKLRQEISVLNIEKNRLKDSYDETQSFADQATYQHDMLLLQYGKLKKLLSKTIDKLIKVNPALIKDIDFKDVMIDPCKEYEPLGNVRTSEEKLSLASLLTANVK